MPYIHHLATFSPKCWTKSFHLRQVHGSDDPRAEAHLRVLKSPHWVDRGFSGLCAFSMSTCSNPHFLSLSTLWGIYSTVEKCTGYLPVVSKYVLNFPDRKRKKFPWFSGGLWWLRFHFSSGSFCPNKQVLRARSWKTEMVSLPLHSRSSHSLASGKMPLKCRTELQRSTETHEWEIPRAAGTQQQSEVNSKQGYEQARMVGVPSVP